MEIQQIQLNIHENPTNTKYIYGNQTNTTQYL